MSEKNKKRIKVANIVIRQPERYKVCEGCESIVGAHVNLCPNCMAYRFDCDSEAVIRQAKVLACREQRTVTPEDLA